MNFTKQLAAIALALGLVCAGQALVTPQANEAFAQEASESHLAAARRAIKASRSTSQLDSILPGQAATLKAELIRRSPNEEANITMIVDEAAIELAPRRRDLENEAAQVFVRNFTEEELNAVADFYESDAGQKFLSNSPLVLREIQRAAQIWAQGIRRDLATKVREKLDAAGLR